MSLFRKKEQQSVDWLIVGLGNPGSEYEQTRHNQGFRVADLLAERLGASYWKTEHKALTTRVLPQAATGEAALLLAKPQTFMNNSGRALGALLQATEVDATSRLIVIHDDLDLPAGDVRIKHGGGHGGHNGLRSIIDALGTRDFIRVRAGIGRPPGRMDSADYVLAPLRPALIEEAQLAAQLAADAALKVVTDGTVAAQNYYHRTPEEPVANQEAKPHEHT
ncbi:MAG: aminoacyl-tRNA hydrolase [Actinomycetia bacterium]|nr:aminoacyl-tRNA hydrolase [Actinomycetes bacterium]